MATSVQIELLVDEKGAVQGIRSFDTAIKGTQGTTSSLDATLKQLNATLEKMAVSGANAGRGAGRSLRQVKEDGLSAREGIHLVTEELDIRMPRAFKNLIANSKAAEVAVKAVGTAIVGIGAIQIGAMIFGQIFDAAKEFYEKWLDIDGAIEKFNDEAAKSAQIKFDQDRSLQQIVDDLKAANQEIDKLNQKKASTGKFTGIAQGFAEAADKYHLDYVPGLEGMGDKSAFGMADAQKLNQATDRQDKDSLEQEKKDHERNVRRIQDDAMVAEARLRGIEREKRAQKEADDEAAENTRHLISNQKILASISQRAGKKPGDEGYVPSPSSSSYSGEEQEQRDHNRAEFQSREIENQRETNDEIAKLNEEAAAASLYGIAQLEARRKAADDDWKREHGASTRAIQAIDEKFFADEKRMLDEQHRETERLQGQAALAGFSGIGKIQAQGDLEIASINSDNNLDDGEKQKRVAAIREQVNAQMLEQERAFTREVDSLQDDRALHAVHGFEQIQIQADKAIDAAQRAFDLQTGQIDRSTPQGEQVYQQHLANFNRQKSIIQAGSDADKADLRTRNSEETGQIEAEAQSKLLAAERQQTAAIEAEYKARTDKYRQELFAREIDQNDFDRRMVAAGEERDAQLVDAAKQAREKMAGEFARFFKDPLGSLKELGDKMAGEVAAAVVQRAQGSFTTPGSKGSQVPFLSGADHWTGDLYARIAGMKRSPAPASTANHWSPKQPTTVATHAQLLPPELRTRSSETATPGAFSLANADIRIGVANISMSGAATAAAGSSSSARGASAQTIFEAAQQQAATPSSAASSAPESQAVAAPATGSTRTATIIEAAQRQQAALASPTAAGATSVPALSAANISMANPAAATILNAARGTGSGSTSAAGSGGFSISGGATTSAIAAAAPSFGGAGGSGTGGGGVPLFASVGNDLNQGIGLYSGLKSTITGAKNPYSVLQKAQKNANMPDVQHATVDGQFDENGDFVPSSAAKSPGIFGKGGILGASNSTLGTVAGAAQGAMGLYSAFEGNGGVGGALKGGLSGLETGAKIGSLFGPAGAAVGAAVGAIGGTIMGAIGFGGREKARVYDLKSVRPRLANDFQAYQTGSMDYTSAYSDMQSLDMEARRTLDKMGGAARAYYWDTIIKEIKQAEAKLTGEQKAGRSMYTMSAAQYDQGGWTGGFGSMATGPDTGWIHARSNEFVVNEQPAAEHAGALEAIRAGASHGDMARYYGADPAGYRAAMQSSAARQNASMVGHTFNVKAWDHRSVVQMLNDHKHDIRSAFNASYDENSGGSDAGF